MLLTLSVLVLLYFGTIIFQFWFSRTLSYLVLRGTEWIGQVVCFQWQNWYNVLLCLCDQGVYPASVWVRGTWRWIYRGMRSIFLRDALCVAVLALNMKSRCFELQSIATLKTVCIQRANNLLLRYCKTFNWGIWTIAIDIGGPNWRSFMIEKGSS